MILTRAFASVLLLSCNLLAVAGQQSESASSSILNSLPASTSSSLAASVAPTSSPVPTSSSALLSSSSSLSPSQSSTGIPTTTAVPASTASTSAISSSAAPSSTVASTTQASTAVTTTAPQSVTTSVSSFSITQQYTTVYTTIVNGVPTQVTSTGSTVVPTTTSVPVTVPNSSTNSNTIDPHTRSIIIGVTVGVGGAIFLALLAFVGLKLWRRRRSTVQDEDDYHMMHSSHGEKPGSTSATGGTPFQSTLESYHNPTHNVNPSANF